MSIKVSYNTLKLVTNLVTTKRTIRPILNLPAQKPLTSDGTNTDHFKRNINNSSTFSSSHIDSYFNEIQNDHTIFPHNIMIIEKGEVIAEKSFFPYDSKIWNASFSFTKTTIGLAIGFLFDEGLIDLDEPYQKILLTKLAPINSLQKDITVRHLLTMSTGVRFNEGSSAVSKEWSKDFMAAGVKFKAGTKFEYNSLNTYILSCIVTKITGENVSDYLKRKLYSKLGINDFYYELSPEGIVKGGWGLYLDIESMAKLGQFILNEGSWNKEQILSREWINLMTTTKIKVRSEGANFDYGFQIWTKQSNSSCCINGLFDQDVLIYKNTKVVIATCCGNGVAFHTNNIMKLHEKYFSKAPSAKFKRVPLLFKPYQLQDDSLLHLYSWINNSYYKSIDKNTISLNIMPFILQIMMNTFTKGFKGFFFSKKKNMYILHIDQEENGVDLCYNFKDGIRQIITFYGNKYDCLVKGTFTRDEEGMPLLMITIYFLEFAEVRNIKFFFEQDNSSLRVHLSETPGKSLLYSLINADKKAVEAIDKVTNIIDPALIRGKINELLLPSFTVKKFNLEEK